MPTPNPTMPEKVRLDKQDLEVLEYVESSDSNHRTPYIQQSIHDKLSQELVDERKLADAMAKIIPLGLFDNHIAIGCEKLLKQHQISRERK